MRINNLISLGSFLFDQSKLDISYQEKFENCVKYSNFLEQDLELWMFVPCDSNGAICEKPELNNYNEDQEGQFNYMKDLTRHRQGLQEVIFKNVRFERVKGQDDVRFYSVGNVQVFNISDDGTHLYWHHCDIGSLLRECEEGEIEFNNVEI